MNIGKDWRRSIGREGEIGKIKERRIDGRGRRGVDG
jgi:hypothetical protein